MAYSDQKFQSRPLQLVAYAASFGTATAGSTVGANTTPTVYFPTYPRRTKINKVRLIVTTIPDDGSTALKASFLNGTDTFATVALTTATANQQLDGTVNTSYNTFAAGTGPTVKVTGTATASADAQGAYTVFFETQELYA